MWNAPSLVPLVDDVVQVFRRGRDEGLEPKVIEHQQVWFEKGLEPSLQSTVGTPAGHSLRSIREG